MSSFGAIIRPRDTASICCSPPDSEPPARLRRVLSTGKRCVFLLEAPRDRLLRDARQMRSADDEVLLDGQRRNDLPALRDMHQAQAGQLMRRPAGDDVGAEQQLSAPERDDAGDHPQQRGLAGPIGAEHEHELAGLDANVHVAQDLDAADAGADLLERDHDAGLAGLADDASRGAPR